jgi:hypothetical protein
LAATKAGGAASARRDDVMKRFKRCCWLAAWGVWLWLGVGLYRELPRELGPKVGVIPAQMSDRCEFIAETHLVAVHSMLAVPFNVRVFDADTGDYVREIAFTDRWPMLTLRTVTSHGVVIAEGNSAETRGLWVVDFVSGEWKRLSSMMSINVAVHPSKPWIAFRESAAPVDKPRSLVVVDWRTGAEVFARPRDREHVQIGEPIFLGDTDRLLVSVTRSSPTSQDDAPPDLEVWRLAPPSRLEKVIRSPTLYWNPEVGSESRVAWRSPGPETMNVDVFDVDAERMIFSLPPLEQRVTSGLVHSRDEGFYFSRDGRTVFGGVPVGIWNLETGERVWSRSHQIPNLLERDETFLLVERWHAPWLPRWINQWLGSRDTIAVYDLDTAALRFRCWDLNFAYLCRSGDGTLGVSGGAVYRLPYRINWPMLAFCQSILATPIVLMWIIVRWRRRAAKRKLAEVKP